ncbi:MAG: tRNA (adenosine(37)-N6)-threonylcarbamoyltransferase complex ATPase subunit type 1 TsaE [bacterium]
MKKISKNIKETEILAREFLNKLKPMKSGGTVVGLYGELGAGKTTFTQSIGKILKIKRKVNSPTFVIMKRYVIKNPHFTNLFHLDAYRLKDEKELLHLGWNKIISNKEHLVFIEWPENIIKAMPKKHHQIRISHEKDGHRKFEIKQVRPV